MSGSTSAFIFIQMRRRPAGFGVSDFLVDVLVNALAQRQRRHRHALELGGLGIAGDEVEDAGHVARDDRIAGEERQVGIDARRHRMIIAGPDMHVGGKRRALAAHHQRQLGMRLELDEAEHDLHAGAFEVARPADIGLLVEARLEFDQRGDGFAGFGGLRQRPDDRGVGGRAIERLLDRDDVGVARRLLQEIHHHVERFERMVDDEILLPDRREAIAAMIADTVGIAWRVGDEFEVGPVEAGNLPHLVERQTPSTLNMVSSVTPSARCTKRRNSTGIVDSMSSLITDPRRRRFNAVSNSRIRSSASSRISTSESRVTRKAPSPLTV